VSNVIKISMEQKVIQTGFDGKKKIKEEKRKKRKKERRQKRKAKNR